MDSRSSREAPYFSGPSQKKPVEREKPIRAAAICVVESTLDVTARMGVTVLPAQPRDPTYGAMEHCKILLTLCSYRTGVSVSSNLYETDCNSLRDMPLEPHEWTVKLQK